MTNKKNNEIDIKPKALVYALSEVIMKETLEYADRWGYKVVHTMDTYKKELLEMIEEIMRLYRV